MKLVFLPVILAAVTCLASCVSVSRDGLPGNWPAIVDKAEAGKFEGTYAAKAASATNEYGGAERREDDLLFFAAEIKDPAAKPVRIGRDDKGLHVEQVEKDGKARRIPMEMPFKDGRVSLGKRKFTEYDALATVRARNRHYLYVAEDGSLIGRRTGYAYGRALFFPAIGTGDEWVLWKRVE